MRWQGSGIEPKPATLAAGVLAIILYGSLYPFQFFHNPAAGGPFHALLATWRSPPSLGDLIANILLYMPLGYFVAQCLRRRPLFVRFLAGAFVGLALCSTIEVTQFYDRGRVPEMMDIYGNAGGALLGALAGSFHPRGLRLPLVGFMKWRPFAVMLVVCWLGYRLYPYVPAFDVSKYEIALEPLFFAPMFSALVFLQQSAAWLAVAMLLETLFEPPTAGGGGRWALLLLVFAVLMARIVIVGISLTPSEVAGDVFAALLWVLLLWRLRIRAALVLAVSLAAVVTQALDPFHLSAAPSTFGLIPFRSVLLAPRDAIAAVFMQKTFAYGTLIWLMVRAGYSWLAAAVLGTALVLFLRIAQVYLPGRSAEITDAVMVVILAVVMKLMDGVPETFAS